MWPRHQPFQRPSGGTPAGKLLDARSGRGLRQDWRCGAERSRTSARNSWRSSPFPDRPSPIEVVDHSGDHGGTMSIRYPYAAPPLRAVGRLMNSGPSDRAAYALARGVHERPVSVRSEEHTSELQSLTNLVCRLLLE